MLAQRQNDELSNLNGRITLQQHDFFRPQPVHDAAAFFVRSVLHNYNDADCVKIIRALVPALEKSKKSRPLLISDMILPEPDNTTRYEEYHLLQVEFCMLVLFGAKERSVEDFRRLFEEADGRFEVVKVSTNLSGMGLLEVHLHV